MGLSTAGLAFKPTLSTLDEQEMLRRVFGGEFDAIPASEIGNFHDIRIPGNVAVESKNGAVFIYSGEIAERILFKREAIEPWLFSALGEPEMAVVFCHYDSGDSFGYLILENGVRTRSRLYTSDKTIEEGSPMAFEFPWLNAEPFVEEEGEPSVYRNTETGQTSSEGYVTAHMLKAAMKTLFGVAPWDEWDYRSEFNYYRKKLPAGTVRLKREKAWWKFW